MIISTPYRVLARKYRPQRFSELIGQEPMVRTLGNAIRRDRLAHAFLMTGVRGVGKTSTARLIAKALNCIGPDGQGGPTIDPCGVCDPCVAIAEGRHVDVIEMDAASNTGVDDVREIIEAVRYAAVSARYKIYIVDEVHMLSKNAFNALLKTLEEPPPHVKFLFATTEVNKVPVTVLSRCQRFDLRRIPTDMLSRHFAHVCKAEAVAAEPEALTMIARAAEGSVRDGLSILDQAIAHADMDGGGVVGAATVRDMLGLADRGALRDLFALLLAGEATPALALLCDQIDLGVDPAGVLRGLLDIVHAVTVVKVGAPADAGQAADERAAYDGWASGLSFAALHRLWQLLLKGHDETAHATDPHQCADMALLRLIHASSLPDPATLMKRIESGQVAMAVSAPPIASPVPDAAPASFAALVDLIRPSEPLLAHALAEEVRVVRYAPPEIALQPVGPFDLARAQQRLRDATPLRWVLTVEAGAAGATLRETELATEAAARDAVLADPAVAAAMNGFAGAELVAWNQQRSGTA